MDGEKVKAFVGVSRACYVVPMKLLCEKSTYFWATFIGGFAEAGTGVSRLPEIDAENSEGILKWMMSGMLATPKKGPGGALLHRRANQSASSGANIPRSAISGD
jgi:hypothetical protein